MKKFVIISLLSVCSSVVFSQLKVYPNGGLSVAINQQPLSYVSFGGIGETFNSYYFLSSDKAMIIHGNGYSWSNAPYWGTSLQIRQKVLSTKGDKGIDIIMIDGTGRGKAIGLTSYAQNALSGYNYGVIGSIGSNGNGTGILGTIDNENGFNIDGKYAGYFYGNVKVTGTINGVVVGNSDIRYKDNIEEFSKSNSGVLSNIMRLNPISYNYKQIYIESEGEIDSLGTRGMISKTEMYDEKSPMFQKKHFGLVAQDLLKIYPDLVYENDNGYLSVNYIEIIPLLIQSIKELKEEVDLLSAASVKPRSATSNDIFDDIPRAVLYQNAPNPFTDRTEIKFALPDNVVNASIFIFNMQGSLLKQIPVNNRQPGITINGSELSAGMYLYSLIVDGKEVDTKRMILTK